MNDFNMDDHDTRLPSTGPDRMTELQRMQQAVQQPTIQHRTMGSAGNVIPTPQIASHAAGGSARNIQEQEDVLRQHPQAYSFGGKVLKGLGNMVINKGLQYGAKALGVPGQLASTAAKLGSGAWNGGIRGMAETAGGLVGGALGSAAGSAVMPGLGTAAGGIAGNEVGSQFAGKLYDYGKSALGFANGGFVNNAMQLGGNMLMPGFGTMMNTNTGQKMMNQGYNMMKNAVGNPTQMMGNVGQAAMGSFMPGANAMMNTNAGQQVMNQGYNMMKNAYNNYKPFAEGGEVDAGEYYEDPYMDDAGGYESEMGYADENNPYAEAAEIIRQEGAGEDTILAHINADEAALLSQLSDGGADINPVTGLPQFGMRRRLGYASGGMIAPNYGPAPAAPNAEQLAAAGLKAPPAMPQRPNYQTRAINRMGSDYNRNVEMGVENPMQQTAHDTVNNLAYDSNMMANSAITAGNTMAKDYAKNKVAGYLPSAGQNLGQSVGNYIGGESAGEALGAIGNTVGQSIEGGVNNFIDNAGNFAAKKLSQGANYIGKGLSNAAHSGINQLSKGAKKVGKKLTGWRKKLLGFNAGGPVYGYQYAEGGPVYAYANGGLVEVNPYAHGGHVYNQTPRNRYYR